MYINNKIINDLNCLGFFLVFPEKYPAEKKALMLVLYPSGSEDLKQVKWGGWENDW